MFVSGAGVPPIIINYSLLIINSKIRALIFFLTLVIKWREFSLYNLNADEKNNNVFFIKI